MKKLLMVYVITTICLGLCSQAIAYPTLTQTESPKSSSPDTYTVKDDSDDPDFFLLDWLYWLLDDVFGWDLNDHGSHYYSGDSGLGSNSLSAMATRSAGSKNCLSQTLMILSGSTWPHSGQVYSGLLCVVTLPIW